ncbi:hypothetical protein EVAR_98364_1 [Eumeta japonica]|uniref:Uncharacterized protein n=1 Tax=Eumeta variegata TaxID=151549 RepID=A0A4C2A4G2_EUMVA|nr:hypothetical protein EVAR_98364_1 [Eumeta japonica]
MTKIPFGPSRAKLQCVCTVRFKSTKHGGPCAGQRYNDLCADQILVLAHLRTDSNNICIVRLLPESIHVRLYRETRELCVFAQTSQGGGHRENLYV